MLKVVAAEVDGLYQNVLIAIHLGRREGGGRERGGREREGGKGERGRRRGRKEGGRD